MNPVAIIINNSSKTVDGGGIALVPTLQGAVYIGRAPTHILVKRIHFQAYDEKFEAIDAGALISSRKTKLDLPIRSGEVADINFKLERGEIIDVKIETGNLYYFQTTILGIVA